MSFSSSYCPVPREQRPIYEYLKIKNSPILSWPTLKSSEYFFRILISFSLGFFISFFLVSNFVSAWQYPIKFFFINCWLTCFQLIILYLYVYGNWFYIQSRLQNPTIFYEESSWYDGKIWIKPATILKQERLISYYQISPLLLRLRNVLQILTLLLIVNGLTFIIL